MTKSRVRLAESSADRGLGSTCEMKVTICTGNPMICNALVSFFLQIIFYVPRAPDIFSESNQSDLSDVEHCS